MNLVSAFQSEFGPDSGFEGCDFRPHFDGWLFNAWRILEHPTTKDRDSYLIWEYFQKIAAWILDQKSSFHTGDKFQIVIGWAESVRRTDRQIIKLGGDFSALELIVSSGGITDYEERSGHTFFRRYWDKNIYETEQGAAANP